MKSWCITHMRHTSEFSFGIYWWTLKNSKNQNFEKMTKKKKKNNTRKDKKNWRYHHFTHVYQKPQSGTVPEIRSDTMFLSLRAIFCPLHPPPLVNAPESKNFEKKTTKNNLEIWRCHLFKLAQQKTQSNDVCLLRYGVWQTIFFHFRSFFALLPNYWPGKLKFGKM